MGPYLKGYKNPLPGKSVHLCDCGTAFFTKKDFFKTVFHVPLLL